MGCRNSSREAEKLHALVRGDIARMLGARKHTEQLGRSATDCARTSDAASRKGSRGRHFIVAGVMARYGRDQCLYQTNGRNERAQKRSGCKSCERCKKDAHDDEW